MKNSKGTSHPLRPKGSKSWTLLLIGELGNTISYGVTKRMVATLAACGAIILALIVLSTVFYYSVRRENKILRNDLDKISAELIVANKARETALVRLMVLDQEVTPDEKEAESALSQKPPEGVSEEPMPPAPPEKETQKIVSQEVEPAAETPAAEPVETSEETEPVPPKNCVNPKAANPTTGGRRPAAI